MKIRRVIVLIFLTPILAMADSKNPIDNVIRGTGKIQPAKPWASDVGPFYEFVFDPPLHHVYTDQASGEPNPEVHRWALCGNANEFKDKVGQRMEIVATPTPSYAETLCLAIRSINPASSSAAAWFTCKTASECVIVHGNCGVEWTANEKFADVSRKSPPRPDMPCKKPLESHPANTVALCLDGHCELYPSGAYAGGTPIGDDCALSSCWGHLGCNDLTCTRKNGSTYTKYAQ